MHTRILPTLSLLFTPLPLFAAVTNVVRPDYQNVTASPGTVQNANQSVISIQGHIKPPASAPGDGAVRLTEASIGQPFAPWIPNADFTGNAAYATRIATEVRTVLYPPAGSSRSQIEAAPLAAFRYKYLLFSPNPGETDVTSHFDNIDDWFNQTDRDNVNAQIVKLRDALAFAPLDTGLRNLLLDCYYDLAVAEMQGAKRKLATLATKRLGLQLVSPFIIDEEIATYEQLVTLVEGVLAKYAELLATNVDGVDPSDFDDSVAPGMPMGYYIFITEQPNRNATPSQFSANPVSLTGGSTTLNQPTVTVASTTGLKVGIPVTGTGIPADTVVKSVSSATQFVLSENATATATGLTLTTGTTATVPDYLPPVRDANGNVTTPGSIIPRPLNQVLFAGYKDYSTYLKIMGDSIRYQAELARLRGMRQNPDDVVKGRNALAKISRETMLDFVLLRGLYPPAQFPPGDASGVNAALNAVETGMADTVNVRSFLNGTGNVLGLDPNFLLLVQESTIGGTRYFDSYDILRQRLIGPNQPVTVALAKKTEAESRYNNFRASVDRVEEDLYKIADNFEDRYFQITGYTPEEVPGFKGAAKPGSGSDLDIVEQTVTSLKNRAVVLKGLTDNLSDDLATANDAVKEAQGLEAGVDSAKQTYIDTSSAAWTEIHSWAGIAAGAQAIAEGDYTIAGAPLAAGPTAITMIANAATQTAAAARTSQRQQEIDYAAIGFEATMQKSDAALTTNQARQEVGSIKREQYAHKLELEDNNAALGQANAQITALQNEIARITASRSANTVAVRTKFYADPIHYIRAESALIEADETFRDAQRWVFYTLRALEHKWQQRFSKSQGSRSYDSGTIFKLRNASELNDMLSVMVLWDTARESENIPGEGTTFISLRDHVLTPNPSDLRVTNTAETGTRVDFLTKEVVTQTELFRRKVLRQMDGAGYISIPFDTVLLEDLNGNFFRGPDYLLNGSVTPGKWRDKIAYVKVNIIGTDGSAIPGTRLGGLSYGGNTFTRTRIPPCGNRLTPTNAPLSPEARDFPAEFTIAPFRYYRSVNYNDVFLSSDVQTTSIDMAYTGATARSPSGEEILGTTFQINAFNQRSVAATRWVLTINPTEVDISKLKDIEIIIKHKFSDREAPVCP